MSNRRELCFVYNAQSGVAHALLDYVHKIVSPSTYACSLCGVTYGNLGMHREWAKYLRALPFKTRFLYKDTLPKHLEGAALPSAYMVENDSWIPVLGPEEMDAATDLEALIALCNKRLADYMET